MEPWDGGVARAGRRGFSINCYSLPANGWRENSVVFALEATGAYQVMLATINDSTCGYAFWFLSVPIISFVNGVRIQKTHGYCVEYLQLCISCPSRTLQYVLREGRVQLLVCEDGSTELRAKWRHLQHLTRL